MLLPQDVADAICGLPVISHISDRRSGAALELGMRRLRSRPVDNSSLSEDQRLYEGTHSLFITCAWGWTPAVSAVAPIDRNSQWRLLDAVVASTLVSVQFTEPSLDLRLRFSNDMSMWVNPTTENPKYRAYSIRLDSMYWSVYGDSHTEEFDRNRPKLTRPVIVSDREA
jgi:hypothetical protein